MNIRKALCVGSLLLMAILTACRGSSIPHSAGPTLSAQSPTEPYPAPIDAVTQAAYPASPATQSLNPTRPPILTQTPFPPIRTPFPEQTQVIDYYMPTCVRGDFYLECTDTRLGIRFKIPSRWGSISASLINGTCGGYYAGYDFEWQDSGVEAGGVSLDYCKPLEGDLFTLARGFEPGQGCSLFYNPADCYPINDNLVIATLFPPYFNLCGPGPGAIFRPLMVVGVNLPGDHPVDGLFFAVEFLSTKGLDQLFEPFGGVYISSDKCGDPQTEQEYARIVAEMMAKVKAGAFDEETRYKVQAVLDFAESIEFIP